MRLLLEDVIDWRIDRMTSLKKFANQRYDLFRLKEGHSVPLAAFNFDTSRWLLRLDGKPKRN